MTPDFIAEMAWKSLVISAAALGMLVLLRSRSAADRATLLRLSVVLLLALPLLSLSLPSLVVEEPAPPAILQPILAAAPQAHALAVAADTAARTHALPFAIAGEDMVQSAYLAGLFLVTARLLAGLVTLRRWTRLARPVHDPEWRAALVRAGGFGVRLLASDHAPSPMSWGLRRPVILIDRASLARPDNADAILAHEMAHVRRRDWPALMLSRLAVGLFWFNPLVWVLERCLVQHAEEAADLQAVVRVEPVGYARTLLDCVRSTGLVAAPANGMAPSQGLARRLGAVLDPRQRGLASGSLWTATAMAACVAVAAPVAALELIPPRQALPPAPIEAPRPSAPQAATTAQAIGRFASALEAQAVSRTRENRRPAETPAPAGGSLNRASLVAPDLRGPWEEAQRRLDASRAQLEEARRLLEARRTAAPETPTEHQRQIARAWQRLAQAQAKAAKAAEEAREAARRAEEAAQAAEPEVIKISASALTLDEATKLRTLGIDTDQVEALAALGYRNLAVKQLVAMHIFHVTPQFITELASLGYRDLTPEQLVELRVHRVTPVHIRNWAAHGYTGLTADQMVQMRLRPDLGASAQQAITQRILGGPSNAIRRTIAIGPSPEAQVEMRLGRAL